MELAFGVRDRSFGGELIGGGLEVVDLGNVDESLESGASGKRHELIGCQTGVLGRSPDTFKWNSGGV